MTLESAAPWLILVVAIVIFLWLDLRLFVRKREPFLFEGIVWSVGWLVLSLAAALVVWAYRDQNAAVNYVTVYLIERSLSLDNLFVFLMLFAYFGIHYQERSRLLFWGIAAALVLRAGAIAGGIALINQFDWVTYLLAALLLLLAIRVFQGVEEVTDPEKTFAVRVVRRFLPVATDAPPNKWIIKQKNRWYITPVFLCFAGIIFADITFAIDSIPAAFAITRDPFLIWMANAFALLGLRALFVVVAILTRRFYYLSQTIAIVLAIVAMKLLLENVIHISPVVSLLLVASTFTGGILLSLFVERKEAKS
jgi:tellurite resistance protein TerC